MSKSTEVPSAPPSYENASQPQSQNQNQHRAAISPPPYHQNHSYPVAPHPNTVAYYTPNGQVPQQQQVIVVTEDTEGQTRRRSTCCRIIWIIVIIKILIITSRILSSSNEQRYGYGYTPGDSISVHTSSISPFTPTLTPFFIESDLDTKTVINSSFPL